MLPYHSTGSALLGGPGCFENETQAQNSGRSSLTYRGRLLFLAFRMPRGRAVAWKWFQHCDIWAYFSGVNFPSCLITIAVFPATANFGVGSGSLLTSPPPPPPPHLPHTGL